MRAVYQCNWCTTMLPEEECVEHEKNCVHNPKNRACQTCKLAKLVTIVPAERSHSVDVIGLSGVTEFMEYCKLVNSPLEAMKSGIGVKPIAHCNEWKYGKKKKT